VEDFHMLRRMLMLAAAGAAVALLALTGVSQAQAPEKGKGKGGPKAVRPSLAFKEEWKDGSVKGEHPVMADNVANASLELKLYGPTSKEIQETGTPGDDSNPPHLWTGLTTGPTAATLRDKNNYVDLSGLGRLRWNTKVSGFHTVRPVVKLADGTMLVGDHQDGEIADWLVSEITLSTVHWLKLDPERVVTTGTWVNNPDLTKVDEIGFADLMPGSGHGQGGWVDVAELAVYGKLVPRK
jgi:hypothetical protein